MRFGICNLSIVPIRSESSDKSEQISQIIYGEVFSILEEKTLCLGDLSIPIIVAYHLFNLQ